MLSLGFMMIRRTRGLDRSMAAKEVLFNESKLNRNHEGLLEDQIFEVASFL